MKLKIVLAVLLLLSISIRSSVAQVSYTPASVSRGPSFADLLTNMVFNSTPYAVNSNGATNISISWSGSPDYVRTIVAITNSTPYLTVGYAPFLTEAPSISGTAVPGQTLTASDGTWHALPSATSTSYQWFTNSVLVEGATATTWQPDTNAVGASVVVAVTWSNIFGAVTEFSASVVINNPSYHWRVKGGTYTPTAAGDHGGSNGGGYQVNDVLAIVGGSPASPAYVIVTTVDENGACTGPAICDAAGNIWVPSGDYSSQLPTGVYDTTGGSGSGAQIYLMEGDCWETFTP